MLRRIDAKKVKSVLWNCGIITLGSFICAVAVNGILVPKHFLSGGFTGLSLIIYYFVERIDLGWLYLILNVPLFVLGWVRVSRQFFFYSLFGMGVFSFALLVTKVTITVHDQLLAAILAGIIGGTGSGIIFRSYGSAGGLDIVAIFFQQKYSVRLGQTILAFNVMVLLGCAFLFGIDLALYTLVYLFVSTYIIELVLVGLNQRKTVFVISERSTEITRGILEQMNRGVTLFKGEGGYTRVPRDIVYTAITMKELTRLKDLVFSIDPDAFVVVNDTKEVLGRGHEMRKIY
ncbi:MAG: YitT family protein [Deltaproteobacteria bacterium]|nr:YitT family protein [Deltaproteobacteria bacterium]MBW2120712.1 YitT family protein [Deltaproteobacteria bacterium]